MFTGHYEFPPYNQETLRSVYHIRNSDIFKLKQVTHLTKSNYKEAFDPKQV